MAGVRKKIWKSVSSRRFTDGSNELSRAPRLHVALATFVILVARGIQHSAIRFAVPAPEPRWRRVYFVKQLITPGVPGPATLLLLCCYCFLLFPCSCLFFVNESPLSRALGEFRSPLSLPFSPRSSASARTLNHFTFFLVRVHHPSREKEEEKKEEDEEDRSLGVETSTPRGSA